MSLSFLELFWLFKVFVVLHKLLSKFFHFCKEYHWDFNKSCAESVSDSFESLENMVIFNNILVTHECWISVSSSNSSIYVLNSFFPTKIFHFFG